MFGNNRQPTVDGGLGRVPASQVDTTAKVPTPRPLTEREANRLMAAEMLAATRSLVDSTTALTARFGGAQGATNGVLDVLLATMPADGSPIARDYPTVVGSMLVTNHGAAVMTYASGPVSDSAAPIGGVGRQRIEPHSTARIACSSRAWQIWGTAGDAVSVQCFTGMQAFGVMS